MSGSSIICLCSKIEKKFINSYKEAALSNLPVMSFHLFKASFALVSLDL